MKLKNGNDYQKTAEETSKLEREYNLQNSTNTNGDTGSISTTTKIKIRLNMKILSFDGSASYKIVRDPEQNNLFNLFQKNVMVVPNITLSTYIVPREYEMRLDRISNQIYGTFRLC